MGLKVCSTRRDVNGLIVFCWNAALPDGDYCRDCTKAIAEGVAHFDKAQRKRRLESAAPDLLEACRKAKAAIEDLIRDEGVSCEMRHYNTVRALNAAIAKAEGK